MPYAVFLALCSLAGLLVAGLSLNPYAGLMTAVACGVVGVVALPKAFSGAA
jgi:hypothetical protein